MSFCTKCGNEIKGEVGVPSQNVVPTPKISSSKVSEPMDDYIGDKNMAIPGEYDWKKRLVKKRMKQQENAAKASLEKSPADSDLGRFQHKGESLFFGPGEENT